MTRSWALPIAVAGATLLVASLAVQPFVNSQDYEGPADQPPPEPSFLAWLLPVLAMTGLIATIGGIAWYRLAPKSPALPAEWGAVESTMRLAALAGAWLERTRRYLVGVGVIGLALWAILLFQLLGGNDIGEQAGRKLTLILALVGLSAWWAVEFQRVTRDLSSWRRHFQGLEGAQQQVLGDDED